MRLYQLVLKVSDDFNPDEADVSIQCDSSVDVVSEGFIGPAFMIDCAEVDGPTLATHSVKYDSSVVDSVAEELGINADQLADIATNAEDEVDSEVAKSNEED